MEAKQLMIGDWVYQALYKDAEIPNKGHGWKAVMVTYLPFDEDWAIEPIPLTEKMLKSNEFRLIGFHKLVFSNDEGGFISYHTVTHCVSVGCDGSVKKNIGYVHELQHALRLCGLNELADNFKIQ